MILLQRHVLLLQPDFLSMLCPQLQWPRHDSLLLIFILSAYNANDCAPRIEVHRNCRWHVDGVYEPPHHLKP